MYKVSTCTFAFFSLAFRRKQLISFGNYNAHWITFLTVSLSLSHSANRCAPVSSLDSPFSCLHTHMLWIKVFLHCSIKRVHGTRTYVICTQDLCATFNLSFSITKHICMYLCGMGTRVINCNFVLLFISLSLSRPPCLHTLPFSRN